MYTCVESVCVYVYVHGRTLVRKYICKHLYECTYIYMNVYRYAYMCITLYLVCLHIFEMR